MSNDRTVLAGGLHWRVTLGGAGPVVLFLHGTGAATHSWRDILPVAAQQFQTVAVDLPGHGETRGRLLGGLTMPGIARALAVLLETMDVRPDLIVGHSAGAAIALRMVLDGLAVPKGVVAIAPALLPFPGIAQALFPAMAKLLFVNPLAPHLFAQVARRPGAVGSFLVRSTGSHLDAAGVAAYARYFSNARHCAGALGMMADWDLVPLKRDLPLLKLPVLVLHGDRDAAIPVSAAREAAALMPAATVEIVARAGHLLHEEHPVATAERILRFARDCGIEVRNEEPA